MTKSKRKQARKFFTLALKGFCMGVADVIPGISGGTIAFILRIYERLISAIKSIDITFAKLFLTGQFKKAFDHLDWKFLFPLFLGIATAIISLAKVMSWALENHPVFVHSFFFGLIIGSIIIIANRIKKYTPKLIIITLISTLFAFYFFGLIPVKTPETWWFLFLSGAIAICAMILPGISGSFILLIFGKYHFVMNAIHERDLAVIAIVGAGVVFGLLSFVRLVSWLFTRHHDFIIAALLGLVIGSLRKIWPWKENMQSSIQEHSDKVIFIQKNAFPNSFDNITAIALIIMLSGFFIAYSLEKNQRLQMIKFLWVGIGGFIGSCLRFGMGELVTKFVPNSKLPIATLLVNLIGCFFIGILYAYLEKTQQLDSYLRLLLIVGFLGGFTTFSHFGFEKFQLLKTQEWLTFAVYFGFHAIFGVLLVYLGYNLTR